jgi:electron transport complex protein RnfB
MLDAVLIMGGLALVIALALILAAGMLPASPVAPAEELSKLLPQTQCGQCGYPGCLPYAQAILDGSADINQCAPGGDATVTALARTLGRSSKPLNPAFGRLKPAAVAVIDEAACIGCTLCIAACPVDAIVGAQNLVHTVLRADCTGCELCLPPCPVDCIDMRVLAHRSGR